MVLMPFVTNLRRTPSRRAALASYARLARRYDGSCHWLDGVRFRALDLLAPCEGETAIDVACGSGAMLPALARAVGSKGRVIGIEQSPEMAALARERIALAGVHNVEILVAPAETAYFDAIADSVLFCYAHDVLQSEAGVQRILSHARPGARVVAAGARLLGWWAAPLNLWKLWRSRHYLTTFRGLRDPAASLVRWCPDWRVVETRMLGTSFLGYGHVGP